MTEDAMTLSTLASLDENETSWDWLIACWRRCRQEVPKAKKVSETPVERGVKSFAILTTRRSPCHHRVLGHMCHKVSLRLKRSLLSSYLTQASC